LVRCLTQADNSKYFKEISVAANQVLARIYFRVGLECQLPSPRWAEAKREMKRSDLIFISNRCIPPYLVSH
jgi:hypothetical protein